jgi:hypothetical protein
MPETDNKKAPRKKRKGCLRTGKIGCLISLILIAIMILFIYRGFKRFFRKPPKTANTALVNPNKKPSPLPPGEIRVFGIAKDEIKDSMVLKHRMQLWEILKPASGKYVISMKHPCAGPKGTFYYTAWIDSDNDGIPDKELDRSGPKKVLKRGAWSSWAFELKDEKPKLFVGNCWLKPETEIYYGTNQHPVGYLGIGSNAYLSEHFKGGNFSSAPNRITNIKVNVIVPEKDSKYAK